MNIEKNKALAGQLHVVQVNCGEAAVALNFGPDNPKVDEQSLGKLNKAKVALDGVVATLTEALKTGATPVATALLMLAIVFGVLFGTPKPAMAVTAQWVDSQSQGALGANFKVTLKAADLASQTTANTTLVITNFVTYLDLAGQPVYSQAVIPSNSLVEFCYARVVTPFATTNAGHTNVTYCMVGDTTTTNLFFGPTDLNNGSAPYPLYFPSASVLTNVTSAGAGTNGTPLYGSKTMRTMTVYRANGCFRFEIWPNANDALSWTTSGQVDYYFRLVTPSLP